jgi:hypothetical protein
MQAKLKGDLSRLEESRLSEIRQMWHLLQESLSILILPRYPFQPLLPHLAGEPDLIWLSIICNAVENLKKLMFPAPEAPIIGVIYLHARAAEVDIMTSLADVAITSDILHRWAIIAPGLMDDPFSSLFKFKSLSERLSCLFEIM